MDQGRYLGDIKRHVATKLSQPAGNNSTTGEGERAIVIINAQPGGPSSRASGECRGASIVLYNAKKMERAADDAHACIWIYTEHDPAAW